MLHTHDFPHAAQVLVGRVAALLRRYRLRPPCRGQAARAPAQDLQHVLCARRLPKTSKGPGRRRSGAHSLLRDMACKPHVPRLYPSRSAAACCPRGWHACNGRALALLALRLRQRLAVAVRFARRTPELLTAAL